MTQRNFENTLIFGAVAAAMFSPYAAVFAVVCLIAGQVAERYFTKNISDGDRATIKLALDKIQAIKTEQDKHSEFINQQKIANSFSRTQGTGNPMVRT